MDYEPRDSRWILQRTPTVLRSWLENAPDRWVRSAGGDESWSPFDIVGHLVHGENTDWIPRVRHIVNGRGDEPFAPFDRFAQNELSQGKSMNDLLEEFERLRAANLLVLDAYTLDAHTLALEGTHPEFGTVTLSQLLATWVAHDLSHIAQIARVMAKHYRGAVGPWREYLSIMDR